MTSKRVPRDRSGPLRRVTATDFSTGDEFLKLACAMIIPDDQTQRRAFKAFMPHLFVLRNKKCSWSQITSLLNEVGLDLRMSTVRTYYGEMLATRQETCQQHLNEQTLLMAEVRKETRGIDVANIGTRVAAILEKQRTQVSSKLDLMFGSVAGAVAPDIASVPPPKNADFSSSVTDVSLAVEPEMKNIKTGFNPAPQHHIQTVATRADDDLPVAPVVNPKVKRNAGLYQDETRSVYLPLRCSVLPEGVEPFKRRDGIEDYVFLPGDLEHPCLPGVMLSLEQRMSSIALEFVNTENGEVRKETPDEKRFRAMWRTPLTITPSSASNHFAKMDMSLFRKK